MTKCPHCGYSNGGRFWRCPLCKEDVAWWAMGAACGLLILAALPV